MKKDCRYALRRTILLVTALAGALACGDTSCDCVTPLERPLPVESRLYDAVQMRLTPSAFTFLEAKLENILATYMQGGMNFEVPPMHQEIDAWLFILSIDVCDAGCTLQSELVGATLTRIEPNVLRLEGHINLSGTITMTGDVECDVPIHIQDKPFLADIVLRVDPRDDLLTFGLEGAEISIEDQDYTLDCSGLLGELVETLKDMITGIMNEQIGGQLDSTLGDLVAGFTCLGCDFYTGGCPSGSSCGDSLCLDNTDGTCLTQPMGVAGTLDLGALLGENASGLEADLDLLLAAGQGVDASVDPLVVNDGLQIRMLGGVEALPHSCVPTPPPEEIPAHSPPDRLSFSIDDTVPGTQDGFMLGLAISDAFLDWYFYKSYLSGFFCLNLDTESSGGVLSSTTLELLMGSLRSLTGDRNVPVRLALKPQHVPGIEIGAGTFTVDSQGNKIIDDPLLSIFLPGTDLDFYVQIDERWVRVVTTTQDLTLRLGLDFLPDNRMLLIFDDNSIVIENVVASEYELLAEDPQALENLVPTLIGLALPSLTGSLSMFEMPGIEGFALNLLAFQPEVPRPESPYYDYLGIYANLELSTAPVPPVRRTRAGLAKLAVAPRGRLSVFAPGGPTYPIAQLAVEADPGPPAEFSWRLDKGGWSVFRPGPVLSVHSPLLALGGEHLVEVRARTQGDYRTLDPEPVRIPLIIQPEDDGLRFEPSLPAATLEKIRHLSKTPTLLTSTETSTETQAGCATSGHGRMGGLLLLALVLAPWMTRRSSTRRTRSP